MSDPVTATEIFLPATPDKRRQFGLMVSRAVPGLVLAGSVGGTHPTTVGAYLLNAFCLISGFLVVFFAIREFKFPGKGRKPGADLVTVFTGFLLITQGAQIFNALKGFQPAHLYFMGGTIFIFKGVMLPEAKIKRGFIISEEEVSYNYSLLRPAIKLPRKNLDAVYVTGTAMNFRYKDGELKSVNMKGKTNLDEMMVTLQDHLIPAPRI